jgi:hypothetical protein
MCGKPTPIMGLVLPNGRSSGGRRGGRFRRGGLRAGL